MPHDRDGERLGVGDTVLIPAHILAIHDTEDYCNVDLETVQPMAPLDARTPLTLNAKQVVLFHPRNASGDYRSKIELASSKPAEGTWQPIATAPRDGTQLWGWDEERGSNPMIWIGAEWVITYDDATIRPTHWMPLPAPPATEPEEE